jgi:hypothetical protein
MKITTKPCMKCGKTAEMEVDSTAYFRWKEQGWHIQTAFPDMPAEQRELLISGTHPACWLELFGDEDDDEDGCEGHESLRGDLMGATFYCDGSCRHPAPREQRILNDPTPRSEYDEHHHLL